MPDWLRGLTASWEDLGQAEVARESQNPSQGLLSTGREGQLWPSSEVDSGLLLTLFCHSPGLPKVPGMAGMPRAHQRVLCLFSVGERVSWPGWEGVG